MTMTIAPTTAAPGDDGAVDTMSDADFNIEEELLWMLLWIFCMLLFLCSPFCGTPHRRKLCWRRIKERRWIQDEGEDDDWYTQAVRRHQEQRRQEREDEQRHFRTTRTEEDDIREQYLHGIMKPYTMTLSKDDIHEMMPSCKGIRRSNSHISMGSRNSSGGVSSVRRIDKGVLSTTHRTDSVDTTTTSNSSCSGCDKGTSISHCDTSVVEMMDSDVDVDVDVDTNGDLNTIPDTDIDLEAQHDNTEAPERDDGRTPDPPRVREIRADSESSSEEDGKINKDCESENDDVVMVDFTERNQKVYVPLPGHKYYADTVVGVDEENPSTNNAVVTCRRLTPSGCTICLCLFQPDEQVTWSSNTECSHVFHNECLLHWYLAVGRKAQRQRLRRSPDISNEEMLSKICDFPTLCPTCRQPFCGEGVKNDGDGQGGGIDSSPSSSNNGNHAETETADTISQDDA